MPKDIVSGDFYWVSEKDGQNYFYLSLIAQDMGFQAHL